ncbi:thermonuclease family protein [uncultured Flavobacterium sp.]|uniref:thermonuclease family protein n=1 Tax=uncultured Flavobacterium sp. TaxID=165435 RepID=UPI0025F75283|nr:thermonuclease family protein [uncultured Flavobacterium sp.]
MKQRKGKNKSKYSILVLLLLVAVTSYRFFKGDTKSSSRPQNDFVEQTDTTHDKEERTLNTFTGKVMSVRDGDTFEVLREGKTERVRLAEVDCPESQQAYGKAAKKYAASLCAGKIVTVTSKVKRDRYNRVVGFIETNDGINVNEALVAAGFAWHYKYYSDSKKLASLENQARAKKVGLWQDRNPTAPWEWRKTRRRNRNH